LSRELCQFKASECREIAADANVAIHQRTMLLHIADTWLRLANEAPSDGGDHWA
jgi:hypothetical protein